MNFRKLVFLALVVGVCLLTAAGRVRAEGKAASVKGYVLDSACAFIKDLKKPVSTQCALACAKAGSPLVILADDGTLYWPISESMPATGQNERLMKFAGQKVVATGKVFEKGGSRALLIENIAAVPGK
ncbi:MAG: hypothetical protein ACRD35_05755 [Candidatus Acidiferrales bacterium]